jgi:hypothetical protein
MVGVTELGSSSFSPNMSGLFGVGVERLANILIPKIFHFVRLGIYNIAIA